MARANLNIDSSVTEAFLSAQESQTVRLITVKIVNEALTLDSTFDKAGSVPEDFDSLLPSTFQLTEAVFGIFNATDGDGAQSWVLVVWIPEGCRVRDKMLYSSSREDLKKSLGLGYFKSDYGANQFEDLTWNRYLESIRKEFSIDHLTETERLILEEKALSINESSQTKATALSVLPFAVSPAAGEQFDAFKNGDVNWLELNVVSEVIDILNARTVSSDGGYAQYLSDEVPCFVATRLSKVDGAQMALFIYFCPENTPVRTKMTMSSFKASVLAAAAERGITFDKTLEVRGVEDIEESIAAEIAPPADATLASSTAATMTHSKPSRPGKGKAKVAKFQA